jgi:hypothetical protein
MNAANIKSIKYAGKWYRVKSFRIASDGRAWFNISTGADGHWITIARAEATRSY